MLGKGDEVPHVQVTTLDGGVFSYATIWQQKNLLLVTLGGAVADRSYVADLTGLRRALEERNTVVVITRDLVPGLPGTAVLVADKWGEVIHVAVGSDSAGLPKPDDLLDWVDYVENRCPECEGEAR